MQIADKELEKRNSGILPTSFNFYLFFLKDTIHFIFASNMYHILSVFCLYSRYFQLQLGASVKRFVSLQFLNLEEAVGLNRQGMSPTQDRYLHRTKQT
jgi:hypothetical protein